MKTLAVLLALLSGCNTQKCLKGYTEEYKVRTKIGFAYTFQTRTRFVCTKYASETGDNGHN